MNKPDDNLIVMTYMFTFPDGKKKNFDIKLDIKTLQLQLGQKAAPPSWARLKFYGCPNCPLDPMKFSNCPIAENLVEMIAFFRDIASYDKVHVFIDSSERSYSKHTSVQAAMSSLLGIYMVTSGCPVMEKLKPMVRFHLPFASIEETAYRVMSMYLLAQYFRAKRGQDPDWEMKDLVKMYEEIRIVNESFSKRLLQAKANDASVNALVILDVFANYLMFALDKKMLDEIERLFESY